MTTATTTPVLPAERDPRNVGLSDIQSAVELAKSESMVRSPAFLFRQVVLGYAAVAVSLGCVVVPVIIKQLVPFQGWLTAVAWVASQFGFARVMSWTFPVSSRSSAAFFRGPLGDADVLMLAWYAHRNIALAQRSRGWKRRWLVKVAERYMLLPGPIIERAGNCLPSNATSLPKARSLPPAPRRQYWGIMNEPASPAAALWRRVGFFVFCGGARTDQGLDAAEAMLAEWARLIYLVAHLGQGWEATSLGVQAKRLQLAIDAAYKTIPSKLSAQPKSREIPMSICATFLLAGIGVVAYARGWDQTPATLVGILGGLIAIWIGVWTVRATRPPIQRPEPPSTAIPERVIAQSADATTSALPPS